VFMKSPSFMSLIICGNKRQAFHLQNKTVLKRKSKAAY